MLRIRWGNGLKTGAQQAWLIDPENRTVEVYRPHREPELLTGLETLKAEGPVEGVVLDLSPV
jgi:Uma2 family endonuclease